MPSDTPLSPTSPITIPPRTSSVGSTPQNSITTHTSTPPQKAESTLQTVPEGDWMSPSSKRLHSSISPPRESSHHHSKRASEIFHTNSTKPQLTPGMWTTGKEKIVLGPYDYMLDHPGKDIRKQFIAAFNQWLKVPEDSLAIITKVVSMLHTSSLLVDDVEDSSVLRRGVPVAHHIFGTAQTINSANYVYFLALQEIQKLTNPVASINVYCTELLNLHRGQGMDLYWRDTLTCPSEEDYLEMVGNKTGGLFRLAIKLMQAESPLNLTESNDIVPLVNQMSLIFQICDDYLNLASNQYTANKGLCEDLTEGKFSFPVIHAIRSNPTNFQLVNILRQKTQSDEVKKYAVSYMEGRGSFEYTRARIRELRDAAIKEIDRFDVGRGQGGGIRKILDKMVEATIGKEGAESSSSVIDDIMKEEQEKEHRTDGMAAVS